MAAELHPLLRPGDTGPAVDDLKAELAAWFERHPPPPKLAFRASPGYGPAVTEAVRGFQRRTGLEADGVAGAQVWGALAAARLRQRPALPRRVHFPAELYPRGAGRYGLQPWIVPQVEALSLHFALQVTAGWGESPPHVRHSDHGWGGAVDLAGARYAMDSCARWAARYTAEPPRHGSVFRYSADEGTHVHLSWYRLGPATSVFDTAEFG
jgi:hypothetical protein